MPNASPPERFDADAFAAATGVSRETLDRLQHFAALLAARSVTLSLVGRATLPELWHRHMLDSAQLIPLIPDGPAPLLDLGTGAGFPGLVLAICGVAGVHLVEHNQQKVRFLRQVAAEVGVEIVVHGCKAEALPPFRCRVVTARALTGLDALLGLAAPFMAEGGTGLFLKGRAAAAEIEAARRNWRFDADTIASVTAPDSAVVRVARLSRR